MQLTISQQLKLDPTTVANFFMNARRRGHDRLLNNSNIETGLESASETSSTRSASVSVNGNYNGVIQTFNTDITDIKPLILNKNLSPKDAKAKMDDCIAAVCCGAGALNERPILPSIFEQL